MKRIFLFALLSVLFLFSCSKNNLENSIVKPEVLATPPVLKTGDTWNYTNGLYRKILSASSDEISAISNFSPHHVNYTYYLDSEQTLLKVIDQEGNTIHDYPGIGLRALAFPLEVGKSWNQSAKLLTLKKGKKHEYLFTFRIVSFEKVEVEAGTFMAYKINWKSKSLTTDWEGNFDMWWAPKVKNYVKRKVYKGKLKDYELTSYKIDDSATN